MRVVNTAVVDYEVRELTVYDDEAEGSDGLQFVCTTATGGSGVTSHITAADVWLRGSIKFDGCSHNYFGDSDRGGYIHGCQREQLTRLGPLYDRLFDWTIELIGHAEFLRPSPL
jgi:hypothetical protein